MIGGNQNEKKILKLVQTLILFVAVFSANTPSQGGMYQPESPKKLRK